MYPALRNKLTKAGFLLFLIVVAGTAGFYLLSKVASPGPAWRLGDCFYMTIITLTTVGFGEVIDVASVPGARLFTVVILLGGLGVSAYFVSSLTAFLVEGELKNVYWRKRMKKEIGRLKGHLILCGAGHVGHYTLAELINTRQEFVLIEEQEEKIQLLQEHFGFFPAVVGDATHAEVLLQAGVERAACVISALIDDKDNLCVVVTCRQLNGNIKVVSRCSDRHFAGKLEMVGAKVVIPNLIGGLRIASQTIRPRVVRYLDTMLRESESIFRIEEMEIPEGSDLVGRQVGDVDFASFGNLLLLAIMQSASPPIYNPDPAHILEEGDTLVLQAEIDGFRRFQKKLG